MNKTNVISLKLEVNAYHGTQIATYTKNIQSDYTPTKEMVFNGADYTLTAKNIYFDLDDGRIFVRFVEYLNPDDATTAWDFLLKQDWSKFSKEN